MFNIESYVTPILLSYVDKYVRDFKPADAQVSLWAGGVTLHNLVLKADVLQQEVPLPFTLVSGRIHELLIQVPWTKIMSEPIVVTINTIECVLSVHPPPEENLIIETPRTQVVEAPPGYMQALVRRIVSNIAVRIHSLIVKYVHDDIVLSLNVKKLSIDSVGANWESSFADIDQTYPAIRRLVRLDDLTLCLDKCDSDGKIRFYQEPLLYRCQLELRVLTRLVSATTRRASSLSVQIRSTKLAWGVTSEQLVLLLRLIRERSVIELTSKPPPPAPKQSVTQLSPLHASSSNSAEPARAESWSEWAWSWLPTWIDREGVEETPAPPTPVPIAFNAYFEQISFVFKMMETEGSSRRRARSLLELIATDAVVRSSMCSPTMIRVKFGARHVTLASHGKCVCGHMDLNAINDEPTIYLSRLEVVEESWRYVEQDVSDQIVENAVAADEELRESPDVEAQEPVVQVNEESTQERTPPATKEVDEFWQKMAPVIYLEYNHDRSPSSPFTNPYDNPPKDFEYSDWVEDCVTKVCIKPMLIQVTMGLLHRLTALTAVSREVPSDSVIDLPMRTLTVEECDALSENLPQRRIDIDVTGLRARVFPWDHSLVERNYTPPLVLDLEMPKATILITGPLYSHRVCSAACQMPDDSGSLWKGARFHVSAATSLQAGITSLADGTTRPCARADIRLVTHTLLYKSYFTSRESVMFGYTVKIREANMCGSSARLQAALQVPLSLMREKLSTQLRNTTLAKDALNDEEAVAVDFTLEELSMRGYFTKNICTHIVTLQSARATVMHATTIDDEEPKQAWIFSAPESQTTSPYLRVACQWCTEPVSSSLEYIGMWIEPTAVCVDPLFIAWLGYRPRNRSSTDSLPQLATVKTTSSSQYLHRRRVTPPSSSGRGLSRSGSGAELVHVRPRSLESSSERSEKKDFRLRTLPVKNELWWSGDNLLRVHERLNRLLMTAEIGLVLVYVTASTASAVDCVTVREAMERHATALHKVLALSLGRLSMHSNSQMKHLWQDVKHDGPTFLKQKFDQPQSPKIEESFPWKMRLADVSCYTLEVRAGSEKSGREKSASGLRSQLKFSRVVMPKTVLEMVSTTVTLSVVTKTLQIKTFSKASGSKKHTDNKEDERVKFFTTGEDFKPSSLKEFIRGPLRRKKASPEPQPSEAPPEPVFAQTTITSGPVVSLGVNLHADTPPIIIRMDQDQVQVVATTAHCFMHIVTILKNTTHQASSRGFTTLGTSQKSFIRSVSEMDGQSRSEETPSENRSEQLISIFEANPVADQPKLKTFFWFQWVVSHATLVVATPQVKLAFDMDDIISTVDLQEHYNQFKVKVASASIRHYKRTESDEWAAGVLGGRVLEAREPANAKEDNHFLAVTITQAQISTLPPSWKEELHPKILEQNTKVNSMWEIYATLAPLEAVLQPKILEHIILWLQELAPRSFCTLKNEEEGPVAWQWPFCYITAGGLRWLLTSDDDLKNNTSDDTFMLVVGKVTVTPHPENPICRRSLNTGADINWSPSGPGLEGRQYEVLVKNLALMSARFSQLVNQEAFESTMLKGTSGENPALKWSQAVASPTITPVLHSMDVGCVLAPAVYNCDAVALGPAIELNLLTDCALEMSVDRLELARSLITRIMRALQRRYDSSMVFEEDMVCPYAMLLMSPSSSETSSSDSEGALDDDLIKSTIDLSRSVQEVSKSALDLSRTYGFDSGVDTTTSTSTYKFRGPDSSAPLKKTVSIVITDHTAKASDFLEVFVTMGVIELSLYVSDDASPEVVALRPPPGLYKVVSEPILKVIIDENKDRRDNKTDEGQISAAASKSLTETNRGVDIGKTKLEVPTVLPLARKCAGNLPLLHLTLHQPNLYFWKKKKQKSLQLSLFNAWLGLGAGQGEGFWNLPLMTTAPGCADPVTDIPPALATLKIDLSPGVYATGPTNSRGTVLLDVERPILFEVSSDRLKRLQGIINLVKSKVSSNISHVEEDTEQLPLLYKLRRYMVRNVVDNIVIETSQVGVRGNEGVAGWDAANLQLAIGSRPEKVIGRLLLTSLLVSAGPASDRRHVVLLPMMAGALLEATWDAWRRAEGEKAAREPTIRVGVDLDRATFDLRPSDLAIVERIKCTIDDLLQTNESVSKSESKTTEGSEKESPSPASSKPSLKQCTSSDTNESTDHYYKDDLRSGAFKIVSGGQLPMAYQVTLHGQIVSWRYPHPRAITRLVAFPIPGLDNEIECALELYCPLLARWEPHTYFYLPVAEPRELQLNMSNNDAVFALVWRVRACSVDEQVVPPFEFDIKKFMPRQDPMSSEPPAECYYKNTCEVSAEQLSGVLRVDSYFAPKLLPRVRLALRFASIEIHAHNELPDLSKQAKCLEGYYVTRPLTRRHRVFTFRIRDTTAHVLVGVSSRLVFDSNISCDILDCATGAMEHLVEEFRVQGTLAMADGPKLRFRVGDVRVILHVPRLQTIRSLAADWLAAYETHIKLIPNTKKTPESSSQYTILDTAAELEGRISLWVHNSCASALRIGQKDTDEVVPLSSGSSLAYRWRSPNAAKTLRFSLASPSADWHWSCNIPFTAGTYRVKLEDTDTFLPDTIGGIYLYVRVAEIGARRDMFLTGRLLLANMLRTNLLFKVRTKFRDENDWNTITSGELNAESVGQSVLCNYECEAVLKVKFASSETGWSGDIPLKECRKENVPWLVKVPSTGDISYTSVWCRVSRAKSDGRVIATIWPFYVLRSHLPLDADVTITTGLNGPSKQAQTDDQPSPPPIVQIAQGRGSCTHLMTPGTTAAHHLLNFQYRSIGCPVTRDVVPLHYGVTHTSVFDKPAPVASVDDVVRDIHQWVKGSGLNAVSSWPYSIVSNHWPGTWKPAQLQPRCDVTIRYEPVRVGGGCSLELQLCPLVLLANASPIALTLRAHDAAPLCKLEPGVAISPPTAMIQKPFFMSVELGRETFVSGQLQVCTVDPGRYGTVPPGHVALDRASNFAIQCNQKVALLTMYYEIKENINVLGISSTYILINKLKTDLLVSAIAVPSEMEKKSILRPKTFKVVHPAKQDGVLGTPLCRFWARGRWRGGDADELRAFLCLALPAGTSPAAAPTPVRLAAAAPARRALALLDEHKRSIPVVVTQLLHGGRWVITVGEDPCPQFLVHNRTRANLAIAQPERGTEEINVCYVQGVQECLGARWWCLVEAGLVLHYSTPAHCSRYPPPAHVTRNPINFLTVGPAREEVDPEWCQPIAVADGEQLLQLPGGVTIKVRVKTHPHSTLIELQDVDQHDISASDIRRRLIGPFSEECLSYKNENEDAEYSENIIRRTTAENNLFVQSSTYQGSAGPSELEEIQLLCPNTNLDATSEINEMGSDRKNPSMARDMVIMTAMGGGTMDDSSLMKLSGMVRNDIAESFKYDAPSATTVARNDSEVSQTSYLLRNAVKKDWSESNQIWPEIERIRCVVGSIVVTLASSGEVPPLLVLHLQRTAMLIRADAKKIRTTLAILDVQIDNAQYDTGQYDFAVLATTRAERIRKERWPSLWGMFNENFSTQSSEARLLLQLCHDKWTVESYKYQELTEVDLKLGPLALYVEDAYVSAALDLFRLIVPLKTLQADAAAIAESNSLQYPLRLRKLQLHSLDLTLTLHTAVRMYIALDQSPLRLSAFQLQDVMTSAERLTHALTVHYLSAAILGAGWVVGGLELLGAPGALAARVGGASGGVRGVASAAAAALLRSLSACAGSLARNLDLLAGDEDHARRAAAARRRPPPNLMAGLVAGVTNFAINILGAVGGLAHHPLVGVAVGESGSSTTALRRGLLGAITKPLSATADLVAYAGQGLLTQTGWDPVPQSRTNMLWWSEPPSGWQRDCVRWSFRLAELSALAGFEALLNDAPLQLLVTHKCLIVADPETERTVEMIDFKFCSLGPLRGQIIELFVLQKRSLKLNETGAVDEDNEYQVCAAAMARVARYTGAEGTGNTEARILSLLPPPGRSHTLYAFLSAALHHNTDTHFPLL